MNLEVTNIRFSYNGHPVLSDVTFSIDPGQIVCVLGVNGAGKSTTINCISGLLDPTSGQIRVAGHDLMSNADEGSSRALSELGSRGARRRTQA